MAPQVQVQGMQKWYGAKHVLKGIDLEVHDREVISILGPNGCGKSTFLRCLNLLEIYQQGQVLLDGQVVSQGRPAEAHETRAQAAAARALRRRVGMVFQRFNLFSHLNVMQNVCVGPRKVLGYGRAQAEALAETALKKVGLWEKHPCDAATLSGGQQQRVAIARALAMDPEMLLFDEATSALDPVLTKEVLKVVRELAEEGMTMILVTHDMDFAREISDRVAFFEAGLVGAIGSPEYIFDERPTPGIRLFLEK